MPNDAVMEEENKNLDLVIHLLFDHKSAAPLGTGWMVQSVSE